MKRIAILLTVHNRRDTTLRCLNSIYNLQIDDDNYCYDIYLTDDGCTDGTRDAVQRQFHGVHIIEGDGTLFWNRGMFVSWREAAKGVFDYYLWLNDDTFIHNDTLERLLECSNKHENRAIIVGMTCAIGKPEEITYGGWINGKVITNVDNECKCETFNGNIVLVPKAVFDVLGPNDPYFRHCLGDTDYGLRANEQGIEVWTAKGIMGECNRHDRPTIWMDPSQPFIKRWKNFFSPLGNNPFEFFYFRRKHYGIIAACQTFLSNFIHFLLPSLWLRDKNE